MPGTRSGRVWCLLVACCLLLASTAVEARRPGPGGRRRVRPTPEEVKPLPEGIIHIPTPERSAVDPAPVFSAADAAAEVTEPLPVPAVEPLPVPGVEPVSKDTATCGTMYTETNIKPYRQQWDSGNGYCGEMSLQMIAITRGIYISQQTSRDLGVPSDANHPDLLFDERIQPKGMSGVFGVAKMLGLYQPPESYWFSDNMTLSASKTLNPAPSAFALWIKKNVIQGRPVIGGFRIKYGSYEDYDHIMPVFGICYNSANSLATTDSFALTDDYLGQLHHAPADASFYAGFRKCGYTGCIPNDYWDYGVAVGPLNVPPGVYYPVKIMITRWSDNSRVSMEPAEGAASTTATAAYNLTVSGLTAGQTYRLYRTTGLFAGFTIPPNADALRTTCTSQGAVCKSIFFTTTSTTMTFSDTSQGAVAGTPQLGQFNARGVTYFLVVKSLN